MVESRGDHLHRASALETGTQTRLLTSPGTAAGSLPCSLRFGDPPVYDAFTPEDRELFLTCKRSLSPERLNAFTEEAVEWLSERAGGNPSAFSDEALRDKVDELVFYEVFVPERQTAYRALFRHVSDGTAAW